MSNVAEIGVRIVADASKLMSGLQKSLEAVDRFGKKVEQAANKIGAVGAAITALGGKLVADASKYDRNVKGAVDRLGNAYNTLATRLGHALIPAVEQLTQFVTRLVHAWDSLAPQQKQAITHYAELAAKILLVVAVGGKVVGMVGQLAGLASVLLPLIPVLVAVAAGVVAVVAIMSALDATWADVWNGAKKTAAESWNWLGSTFGGVIDRILGFIVRMIRAWAEGIQKMLDVARPLFRLLKIEGVADFGKDLAGWIASLTTKNGWEDFAVDGRKAISDIANRLKSLPGEVKKALRAAGLGSMLDSFSGPVASLPTIHALDEKKKAAPPMAFSEGLDITARAPLSSDAKRLDELMNRKASSLGEVFSNMAEEIKLKSKLGGQSIGNAFAIAGSIIGQAVVAAAPKFNSMVSGAMQGAQSGGVWGAIIGAIASLLTQTQAFGVIMGLMEDGVGTLIKAINPILKPLILVSKFANIILDVLMRVVGPAFELVGRAFFEVTKGILEVVRWIVHAVRDAWNWIVVALAQFLWSLGLNDAGNAMQDLYMRTATLDAAFEEVLSQTWEGIDATETKTKADNSAAAAVERFTESLTNVPQGFKVAAARFSAMAGGGSAKAGALGSTAFGRGGGAGSSVYITVQGSIIDAAGLLKVVAEGTAKTAHRRTGSPVPA